MMKKLISQFEKIPTEDEESIIENVENLISHTEYILEQDFGSGDLSKFVTGILSYQKKILIRFKSNLNEDIDFHSWLARNIYELYVLAKYGLQTPERISTVLLTAVDDYRDIKNVLFENSGLNKKQSADKDFLESMEKLDSVIDEHELEIEKWKSAGQMANETDSSFDHRITFKITSKYVHPTSLFLFGNENFVHGIESRKAIFSISQWYAARLLVFMPKRIGELKKKF